MFNIFKVLDRVELVSENVKETIPFYYSRSRHMLVDVRINGSKTKYPFILDSGATTYVFKNMLDQQQLPDIGMVLVSAQVVALFFQIFIKLTN